MASMGEFIGYQLKTDLFKDFRLGEVIYPHNDCQQYGKLNASCGDNCIPMEVIKALPDYFELVEHLEFEDYEINRFARLYKQAKDLKYI